MPYTSTQPNTGLDLNAHSLARTRRNWSKLAAGLASTSAALSPTGGIVQTSTGLALNFTGEGSLLTIGSTGAVTFLPVGSTGQVLTVSSTSSTDLAWTNASGSVTLNSTGGLTSTSTGLGILLADNSLSLSSSGLAANILPTFSTNPTNLRIGEMWFNTTFGQIFVATSSTTAELIPSVLAAGGPNISITNSNTPQSFLFGSISTAAGFYNATNRLVEVTAFFTMSAFSLANTFTWSLTLGSTTVWHSSTNLATGGSFTAAIHVYLTVAVTGSSGETVAQGLTIPPSAVNIVDGGIFTVPINLTATLPLDMKGQWGTATPLDAIQCTSLAIELLV